MRDLLIGCLFLLAAYALVVVQAGPQVEHLTRLAARCDHEPRWTP